MECQPRIVRERTVVRGSSGSQNESAVMFYCPLFGEIVLTGERAEEVRRRLREAQGNERNPFASSE